MVVVEEEEDAHVLIQRRVHRHSVRALGSEGGGGEGGIMGQKDELCCSVPLTGMRCVDLRALVY